MTPLEALKADTHRIQGRFGWGLLIRGAVSDRWFRVVVSIRLCQAASNLRWPARAVLPFLTRLHVFISWLANTYILWQTDIGPGFMLCHAHGVTVHPGAKIGGNVTLLHGVTLGGGDLIDRQENRKSGGLPVIGDDVWIGPYAQVNGALSIGRGSRLLAGAIIKGSVAPYSKMEGNPAVCIKDNCVRDVLNPAPFDYALPAQPAPLRRARTPQPQPQPGAGPTP
jgi:serine O-acetyltransferase